MKSLYSSRFQFSAVLFLSILSWANTSLAQVTEHRLIASDGEEVNRDFGRGVSLWEGRALIGADSDDERGSLSGSAYVFELQGDGSWIEVAKLTASDGAERDFFGFGVSLQGERALVGASGADNTNEDSGSAYVFERQVDGSWAEVAKLIASDGVALDYFGDSVSLWGDRALIGAFGDANSGAFSGSAYVFERQGDGSWAEVAKLTASDAAERANGGFSVSLRGERALVGAPGADNMNGNSGAAYIFERQSDGSWIQVARLPPPEDASEYQFFGHSVSLLGERALVGANGNSVGADVDGAAYVFERQSDGSWLQVAKLTATGEFAPAFGASVSLSEEWALVGDFIVEHAFVYDLSALTVAKEGVSHLPENFLLSKIYPNPFNQSTEISFDLPEASQVQLTVYNAVGQEVARLMDGVLSPGTHRVTWQAGDMPSGVYLYRITASAYSATRTMALIR